MKNKAIPALVVAAVFVLALCVCAQTQPSKVKKPAVKNKPAAAQTKAAPAQKTAVKTEPAAKSVKISTMVHSPAQTTAVSPFDEAVQKLSAKEAALRRQGADFLAQSRDQKAKPYLINALKDESAQVRIAAVDGLGMLSARETVPQLAEILTADKEPIVRQAAAISLSYIMDPAAGPALLKALIDPFPAVKYAAAHTLGAMKYLPAQDLLISMLDNADTGSRRVAIAALGDLQSKKAAPAVLKMFKDEDKYTRLEAMRAIGNIGDKSALDELKKSLDSREDPAVRAEAALALSKMDDPSGLDAAYELIKSPDFSLKSQAMNIIGNVGDKHSLKLMEEMYAAEQDQATKNGLDFIIQRIAARLKIQSK